MQKITIPNTNILCSRFIFGTASLFKSGNVASRYRLLKSAVDSGFSHFDTAPYYGFGSAERDLKDVLREHPELTVTTKVGIYSPGGESQTDSMIFFRKAGGRLLKSLSKPTKSFDLLRASEALDGSLRRLGRSVVDVYALHEPEPGQLITDEWLRWLENQVRAGKVKYFGIASTHERLEHVARECVSLCAYVQIFDSLKRKEADVLRDIGLPMQVTYGYVSAARREGDQRSVESILLEALMRNSNGAIIVSTTKAARTRQYAEILGRLRNDKRS